MKRAFSALGSISRMAGGLFESVRGLVIALNDGDLTVDALAPRDQFTDQDRSAWWPAEVFAFSVRGPRTWGYSPGLRERLTKGKYDIGHLHGLWMYPSTAVHRWSSRFHRPYLVSPRGMLDPWALAHSAWKKRIVWLLNERSVLQDAGCMHALNQAEAAALRRLGLANPICVVPNGVALPDRTHPKEPPWPRAFSRDRMAMVYLGRFHPKKNLSALLSAWDLVRRADSAATKEWVLILAGWDQGGTRARLERQIRELRLSDSVLLLGPQYGENKRALLDNAGAFVLPSLSEGLPMAVLEAWAHGLPVLMSAESNLPEGFAASAAIETGVDAARIARALSCLFAMSAEERKRMAQKGRRLVEQRFSLRSVAREMKAVYDWLLGGGTPPSSVMLR